MFKETIYPEFSWSLSRHKTFLDCQRKYAYDYYIGHNGWKNDAPTISRDAYRLKKITNLEMLFGNAVHDIIFNVIKQYLSTNHIPSESELILRLRNILNTAFQDSMHRKSLWIARPKYYTMLHEIYYNGSLPVEKVNDIQERLDVCIKHFFNSKTFTDIINKRQMRFVEAERFRYMKMNDVKITIVMDFVYRDIQEGKWIIVDWKTGKESFEDRHQLALYAMYLQRAFNVKDLDEIEIRNEYLLSGTHKSYKLNPVDLDKLEEMFGLSIQTMLNYLEDPEQNKPFSLEYFPKTEYEKKCERCNFKELCEMY
ncbi:PD-(D/E)XK nuclease family protein [Neobacillus sp. SAB-20_R2A]|uniref:PD-(D/E)XK nuclease family protein n=1 Tax=Neobacillus sp. SAB-20_R2A TaxID=3120519 RepID=UPI003C6E174F